MVFEFFAAPFLLTTALIFPFLTHPVEMAVAMLLVTLLIAVMIGATLPAFWLSYTLILILLGGLLVIFIYVALLAPNEQFNFFSFKVWMIIPLLSTLLMLKSFYSEIPSHNQNQTPTEALNQEGLEWLTLMYSNELLLVTLFLVCYLFLALIVVVNNTKHYSMTLRSITK